MFQVTGAAVKLPSLASWSSVWPVGYSPVTRQIYGLARTGTVGTGTYQLVKWDGTTHRMQVIRNGMGGPVVVDGSGDVTYRLPDGSQHVLLASGGTIELASFAGTTAFSVLADVANAVSVYGEVQTSDGATRAARWDVAGATAASGFVTAQLVPGLVHPEAVGTNGDVAGQLIDFYHWVLRTRIGKVYAFPPWWPGASVVVEPSGAAIFTARDGLPHRFTCPL